MINKLYAFIVVGKSGLASKAELEAELYVWELAVPTTKYYSSWD